MRKIIRASHSELLKLTASALEAVGVPHEDADLAAEILVTADLIGIDTHGTRRLAPYVARLRDGVFNARPTLKMSQQAATSIIIDGNNGLGPVIGTRALDIALETAAKYGTAFVACRNSQHFGALAPYAMRACKSSMVCFLGTNAFPTMAPWGGKEVKIGNNPIGLGAPRRDAPPFILDIAMSVAARGKMRKAAQKGERIPVGWALDKGGNPTTDPNEGLNGYVLPIGGHKGYGIALAVDILAGVLSGGAVATEVQSLFKQKERPQQVCHFFIVIDPAQTIGTEAFLDRIETLCLIMKETEPIAAGESVLVPGEIEARKAGEHLRHGIPMDEEFYESLRSLARGEAPDFVANA